MTGGFLQTGQQGHSGFPGVTEKQRRRGQLLFLWLWSLGDHVRGCPPRQLVEPGKAGETMEDCCAVCAEPLEWTAYGPCGHKDACSKCVTRLRFALDDTRCVICQQQSPAVMVARFMGTFTDTLPAEEFADLKVRVGGRPRSASRITFCFVACEAARGVCSAAHSLRAEHLLESDVCGCVPGQEQGGPLCVPCCRHGILSGPRPLQRNQVRMPSFGSLGFLSVLLSWVRRAQAPAVQPLGHSAAASCAERRGGAAAGAGRCAATRTRSWRARRGSSTHSRTCGGTSSPRATCTSVTCAWTRARWRPPCAAHQRCRTCSARASAHTRASGTCACLR